MLTIDATPATGPDRSVTLPTAIGKRRREGKMSDRGLAASVWGAIEKSVTINQFIGGVGGVMTTSWLGQFVGPWSIFAGVAVFTFLAWVLNKRFPRTVEVEPMGGQGPTEIWTKASLLELRHRVVSHRYVKLDDIYSKRSRANRGDHQEFEHCLIEAKHPTVIYTNHSDEKPAKRPFTKGVWFPYFDLETKEEPCTLPNFACQRVFFRSCEFRGIKFRVDLEEKVAIDRERGKGEWVIPLADDMKAAFNAESKQIIIVLKEIP